MSGDRHRLMQMHQRMRLVERMAGQGRAVFMGSETVRDAVLWNLELICLAARRISQQQRRDWHGLDWDQLCALTKTVIGDPWQPDHERIWQWLEKDLPVVEREVSHILAAWQGR